MATRLLLGVLVGAMLAACTTTESTPATTPSTTAATTTIVTPITAPPTTMTTSDRLGEIEAIFQDLEERRLDALYRGDVEAFSALFANEAYLERSLQALEIAAITEEPVGFEVTIDKVYVDSAACISLEVTRDFRSFLGAEAQASNSVVLEASATGWGYSYETESENWWDCTEPHPLDT